MIKLIQGECLEKMQDIPDKSIDAIITDPPYIIRYNFVYPLISGIFATWKS